MYGQLGKRMRIVWVWECVLGGCGSVFWVGVGLCLGGYGSVFWMGVGVCLGG